MRVLIALSIVIMSGSARLALGTSAGLLDLTFGTGGRSVADFPTGSVEAAHALVLQPDGKLVAAGSVAAGRGSHFAIARYHADGSLDASFGTGGLVTTVVGGGAIDRINGLAVQADGKIVAVGFAERRNESVPPYPSAHPSSFVVARYETDGTLDTTFGTGGLVLEDLGFFRQHLKAVLVQPDGKIVAVGDYQTVYQGASGAGVVFRFESDGTRDAGFATGGLRAEPGWNPQQVVRQLDGKLLLPTFTIKRLNPDGTTDTGFDGEGLAGLGVNLQEIALQPDGRIVAGGNRPDGNQAVLARFESDGTLDGSFGTGGMTTVGTGFVTDIAVAPDGSLAAGLGSFQGAGNTRIDVARLTALGVLDPAFGAGGTVRHDVARGSDSVNAMAVLPDGRIVVAGSGVCCLLSNFALARLFSGTCGDGELEPGEECDDGNLLPGDGCDGGCCVSDADGDGTCDSLDPCTGPGVPVAKAKVVVRKLGPPNTLTLSGEMTLPHPFSPALDPLARGLRVLVDDGSGTRIDVTLGGGAPSGPRAVGWTVVPTVAGSKWTWTDKRPLTAAELVKAVVQDRSNITPGLVRFTITGKKGAYYLTDALPLAFTVVLDSPTATTGQCGRATFPGPPPAPTCTADVVRLLCK